MAHPDFSTVKFKRFVVVYMITMAVLLAIIAVLIVAFNIQQNLAYAGFAVPFAAALDTGMAYANTHNTMLDGKFAWKLALRLNYIHMLINILLAILVLFVFRVDFPLLAEMPLDKLLYGSLISLVVAFFISWLFIHTGLKTGAKTALKQAKH